MYLINGGKNENNHSAEITYLSGEEKIFTEEQNGFLVEVKTLYLEHESTPLKNQYYFHYKLKITNLTEQTIQINFKHLKIKDGRGRIHEEQAATLNGARPYIKPNESYTTENRFGIISRTGNIRGKLQAIDEMGERLWIQLPLAFFS